MKQISKEKIIYIIFIVTIFLLYFPANFFVAWDLTNYLVYARNFAEGFGFTDAAGNPASDRIGYVVMLSGIYKLFGNSLLPVVIFETLWSVLFILGLLFVTRRLFNITTAFFATSLFSLSPAMIQWLPRHIDAVWPALLFWSLYFLIEHKNQVWRITFSALLAAYAFWVKELAILFIFIPITVKLIHSLEIQWSKILRFYINFALFAGVSILIGSITASDISELTSGKAYANSLGFVFGENPNIWNLVKYGFEGLLLYFVPSDESRSIYNYVPLLPLMGVATIISIWKAFKGDSSHKILLVTIIVFLPYAAICGQLDLRPSQILFLIACLYILLGTATIEIVKITLSRFNKSHFFYGTTLIIFFIFTTLQFKILTPNKSSLRNLYNNNVVYRILNGQSIYEFRMRGNQLAEWFWKNADGNAGIIIGNVPYQHGVSWLMPAEWKINYIPFHQISRARGWVYYDYANPNLYSYQVVGIYKQHVNRNEPVVSLFSEQVLRSNIEINNVKYITIATFGIDQALIPLFDSLSYLNYLEEIIDHGRKIRIYKVLPENLELDNYSQLRTPMIDIDFIKYMNRISHQDDNLFSWYTNNILIDTLGLENVTINSLLSLEEDEAYKIVP